VTAAFYRPCWVDIDTAALRQNWRALKKRLEPAVAMLAVVKANAYGHGLATCARVAAQEKAAMLGVSSVEEGIAVRKTGLDLPVLVLGSLYPFSGFPLLFKYHLTPTIASLQAAEALDQLARSRGKKHPVHLKVDTGFGRIGVRAGTGEAALTFIRKAARLTGLKVEGLYTHFSSADVDARYTRRQHTLFQDLRRAAAQIGVRPRWIHEANSSALLRFPETHSTMVRPGLAFYGVDPYKGASTTVALEPVLTWKSRVVFLKTVPAGFPVSYAKTWTSKRQTRVATLAVGYADGYPRILSNKSHVLIAGCRVPVIGRITMDMIMVDVTNVPSVRVGDEAVLIGKQGRESISAGELAGAALTNPYEILCRIADRVPRIVR